MNATCDQELIGTETSEEVAPRQAPLNVYAQNFPSLRPKAKLFSLEKIASVPMPRVG